MKSSSTCKFAFCVSVFLFCWASLAAAFANHTIDEKSSVQADRSASEILGDPKCLAFSYGGYRGATRDEVPTVEQLKEDMKILSAMGVKLIRTYNTQQFAQAENLLIAIDQLQQENEAFEMYVMLGAWIDCKGAWTENADHDFGDEKNNQAEIDAAVDLAKRFPKSVKMIAVGNEAMVHWATNYFVEPGVILKWVNHLQNLKSKGDLSSKIWITTSDNFASWGGEAASYHKPDLNELIKAVDFISIHTYPFHDTHYVADFWIAPATDSSLTAIEKTNAAVDRAVDRAKSQYQSVVDYAASLGVKKPVHIGETGWASVCTGLYGAAGSQAADEYKAGRFYDRIREWTNREKISCFYFEAFDEKWKDLGNADGSENHFGLIDLDGHAKYPLWSLVDSGAFKGLTRGGKPITKSYDGDEKALLAALLPVPSTGNWDGTVLANVNDSRKIGEPVSEENYLVFHSSMTVENTDNATYPSKPIKLNVWEGTCELERKEGEMHLKTGAGAWWGCGLEIQSDSKGEDLSNFSQGVLHFEIKGETQSKFVAGFQTGRYAAGNQTNNGVMFGPGEKYQLSKEWEAISIPVSQLIKADAKANLKDVTSALFLKGEKDFDGKEIQLRNVRYSKH
jgi:exo-beta-1,3-glucanase (GH17 family)